MRHFEFVDIDLRSDRIEPLLDGVDVVFHQAAQPGVRLSWSAGFGDYVGHNVLATQRLLEAVVAARPTARVVNASSSSVYGNQPRYPTRETDLPKPFSPYGVTKLAAEHLCGSVRRELGRLDGVAALLHGVRSAPAARHVDPPVVRGRDSRRPVPALRRRVADPRVHVRRRHRAREPARRRARCRARLVLQPLRRGRDHACRS